MEYMSGGNLLKWILREGAMPEPNVRMCILKLIQAVKFCHDKHILHRDICLENLVIGSP